MMEIDCPWCGPRDQSEFRCGGEAHIVRPTDSTGMSDAEWGDYVFARKNRRGIHHERWHHVHGCRRWFNLTRDTVSDRILAVYRVGETSPVAAAPARARSLDKPGAGEPGTGQ